MWRAVIPTVCALLSANLFAYTVTDIDGNAFEFETPPKVASITPSVSETICDIGMYGNLLGVSRYCDYPEKLKLKPKLGGFIDPEYEKILSLKPELIIIPKTSDSTVRDKFRRLGLRCFLIHPDGIENVSKNVVLVGGVFDREKEAKTIAAEIEREIVPVESAAKPKALLLFGKMAAGKGAFAGGLLERAGFENMAYKANSPWPVLSREFILTNPPEVIIVEVKEGESFPALVKSYERDSFWARTPAVKNGRIYPIDSQIVIVPGPRIVRASKRLKDIASDFMKHKNAGADSTTECLP